MGNFWNTISRDTLNNLLGRANPAHWMHYSNAKIAITLYSDESGSPITQKIRNNAYINDRAPVFTTFVDASRLRIG